MTWHDGHPPDDAMCDLVHAYVAPEDEPPLELIRGRARTIRRRKTITRAAVTSSFVLIIALATLAAASPSSPNELSVADAPHSTTRGILNATATTTTAPPELAPSTTPPGTPPGAPPGRATPSVPATGSASTPSTARSDTPSSAAPVPDSRSKPTVPASPVTTPVTNLPTTTPPPTAPPTTAAPAPQYPPVGAGHTRLLIVLDDTGMHAPESFSAGPAVEILFVDARSTRGALSYLVSDSPLVAPRWNGTMDPIPSWKTGVRAVQFRVLDSAIQGEVPGSQFGISFIAP